MFAGKISTDERICCATNERFLFLGYKGDDVVIYKKAPDEREYSGALLADKNKRTDIRF